jgi:hypothetical protein
MIETHHSALVESVDAGIAEHLDDARASAAGPVRDPLGQERTKETGNPR